MADTTKDTIYIDIDDEITGIIDKVRSSNAKILALVLPKRASVFQSIVNMKLLKRSADEAKKHLVLITAEAGLLPLAGAVGLHVAKSLTTKPEIPLGPLSDSPDEEETAELGEPDEVTKDTAGKRPVGELAGMGAPAAAAAPALAAADGIETLELDNDEASPANAASSAADAKVGKDKKDKKEKAKKDKKLHVPNFERFRLWLILGGLVLILLVGGLILAFKVLPKATISIQTDDSTVNTSVPVILSTKATSVDPSTGTVPAKQVQEQKTFTGTANATGQQNNGQKANGSVVISAQVCAPDLGQNPADVPAGTGVSSGGQTYITQEDANFTENGFKGGSCANYKSQSIDITAQNAGASSNTVSGANFTVAGSSDTGTGSATGGTDNIQQIVTQADIDNATSKISTANSTGKQDLTTQLTQDNLYPIAVTFNAGTPTNSANATAGSAGSSVTVTETIAYTMLGAREDDLKSLIDANIKTQVNTAEQGILNDGFSNASFTSNNTANTNLTMATTAEVGPEINTATIKQQAAGKKSADIQSLVKNDSNVTGVSVKMSPFWVTTAPHNTSKITVNVAKPTASSNASNP
jgi:hypothetical protein